MKPGCTLPLRDEDQSLQEQTQGLNQCGLEVSVCIPKEGRSQVCGTDGETSK